MQAGKKYHLVLHCLCNKKGSAPKVFATPGIFSPVKQLRLNQGAFTLQ